MRKRIISLIGSSAALFMIAFLVNSCKKNKNELDCSKIKSAYNADINPIISGNCTSAGCHNAGSLNGDFTTYAGLKTKADNGSVNSRVIEQKNMPPSSNPLTQEQINKIDCWLKSGAPNN